MEPESIKVTILFFGAAADIARKRNEEFAFPAGTNARAAFENILAAYPQLSERFKGSLLLAVNQEYAKGDEILNEGDELAFIPPVSGG
jgi:molybdopterin converting factor subunit 1